MFSQCPICRTMLTNSYGDPAPRAMFVNCPVCGKYQISERLATNIHGRQVPESYLYSAAIRERQLNEENVWIEDLDVLLDSVKLPQNPFEKINKILLYVFKKSASFEEFCDFSPVYDYSTGYAKSIDEFKYLLKKAEELKLLEMSNGDYRLTLDGWKHIAEISQNQFVSDQAFVAMWFDPSLNDAYQNGLKPALEQTGYIPLRIDQREHNEKIDDKIIAEIRKSGLLVADFTGHRGGVYFETGFAMGLGIPVIWTCREDFIEKAHFDTRQYNHIVWTETSELKEKLVNRIEATLPSKTPGANIYG